MNIKNIITTVEGALTEVQAGIAAGEHVVKTVDAGDVTVGQIVNAAGHLKVALDNLKNHEPAIAAALENNGGAAPVKEAPSGS